MKDLSGREGGGVVGVGRVALLCALSLYDPSTVKVPHHSGGKAEPACHGAVAGPCLPSHLTCPTACLS